MDNVALTLLLTIVAALLVIAVVVLYRKLGQKEAEPAALASDACGLSDAEAARRLDETSGLHLLQIAGRG